MFQGVVFLLALICFLLNPKAAVYASSEKMKQDDFGIAAGGILLHLSQEELEHYFLELHKLGASWVRWDMDWSVIQQKDRFTFNWGGADRVVATAEKYGIKSLAILTYTPEWARYRSCSDSPKCQPASVVTFGVFASKAAARYKGRINHWEIWNEPNITAFWLPKPNISRYSSMLQLSSILIKLANPLAVIVTGGLSPAGDEVSGNIAPTTYVKALYENQVQKHFDAIALHPYTYPGFPDEGEAINNWYQLYLVRNLMVTNGDGNKRIWITEFGAPTGGSGKAHKDRQNPFKFGADYMSEWSQWLMAQQAGSLYLKNHTWMGPFFWYTLKDRCTRLEDTESFFGVIRCGGTKKPAYYQLLPTFNNQ